jgi:single-strand DNA-binding protein
MFQQTILVGNLGNDVELRYTPAGVPVASFSLAVNRKWTGPDGRLQEKTTWFRVTAWRKDAENAAQYLHKGSQTLVVGEIETPNVWTDRDGKPRASLELTARTIRFLYGSGGGGGAESGGTGAADDRKDDGDAAARTYDDEDIPF